MSEGFKIVPAVHIAVVEDGNVLLIQRENTGWMDGYYDLPAGHVEPNESFTVAASRELNEETGLVVTEEDMQLFHVCQNYVTPGRPFLYHMFKALRWSGTPAIKEPDKCGDLGFFSMNDLPETVHYVEKALGLLASETVTYSFYTMLDSN
jgi:8-oxo-dGTP diphosphatase